MTRDDLSYRDFICPLKRREETIKLGKDNEDYHDLPCVGPDCAWFDWEDGNCAVLVLVKTLKASVKSVKKND